ncbi:hypothetical protein P0136_06545 [Lentisphaerota bacterium ZTH]|nr:hypothetical protein JYG24_02345 [Lentisphaerota bacterium]WET07648.1 hypothetical protein P0136_06545 [Lentisphaerota bacterium ZTH]
MANNTDKLGAKAQIDFHCLDNDCEGIVKFNLADVASSDFQAVCEKCHRPYELDGELRKKLQKMLKLIVTIREVEDILGDCSVSVTVAGGEVKIPYALLLTRLNTMISLNYGNQKVDFHLWVEPSSPDTFR